MGERPDLSRATYWDLWYAVTCLNPEIRGLPETTIDVPLWEIDPVTKRYQRTSLATCRFWADVEFAERRRLNHDRAIEEIKAAHTRELLKWLDYTRTFGGWYSPCQKSERDYGFSAEDIKAELSTREHIPNKLEARNLRREAALMHRKNKKRCNPGQRSQKSPSAR